MIVSIHESSPQRNFALIAGVSLMIMTVAASFSYGFVHESLVVQGDGGTTFHNIASSHALFRAGIFGWLVILLCDAVVAWSLYMFLKPVHASLSLLGALLRLVYTAILGIAILNLVYVLLLSDSTRLLPVPIDQLPAYGMVLLDAFDVVWSIGLIVFGGHLIIIGYLTFISGSVPKVISILLFIAAVGYMIVHFGYAFLPQYDGITAVVESIFTIPMILGELGFAVWLLIKGGKASKHV